MIFVTVGTHEQPFDRLVREIDRLKMSGIIEERVVVQSGYSNYEPEACDWKAFYPYEKMADFIDEARIVITHGGPSSFIMPLQIGKIPVVVPRRKEFGEHVNNHQVDFVEKVCQIQRNIIPVYEISDLKKVILDYDRLAGSMHVSRESHNEEFITNLKKIIDDLFENKKVKG